MAITRLGGANAISGTIPQGNIANASLGAVTSLPAAIATGKVLQVVSGNHTSQASTTGTTFVDLSSNTNVSITPASTSNKVLVMAHFNECFHNANANAMGHYIRVTAAGTEIHRAHTVYHAVDQGEEMMNQDLIILHSPNSTSAVEYKMQFRSQHSGQSAVVNQNSAPGGSSLILMEIEG